MACGRLDGVYSVEYTTNGSGSWCVTIIKLLKRRSKMMVLVHWEQLHFVPLAQVQQAAAQQAHTKLPATERVQRSSRSNMAQQQKLCGAAAAAHHGLCKPSCQQQNQFTAAAEAIWHSSRSNMAQQQKQCGAAAEAHHSLLKPCCWQQKPVQCSIRSSMAQQQKRHGAAAERAWRAVALQQRRQNQACICFLLARRWSWAAAAALGFLTLF